LSWGDEPCEPLAALSCPLLCCSPGFSPADGHGGPAAPAEPAWPHRTTSPHPQALGRCCRRVSTRRGQRPSRGRGVGRAWLCSLEGRTVFRGRGRLRASLPTVLRPSLLLD